MLSDDDGGKTAHRHAHHADCQARTLLAGILNVLIIAQCFCEQALCFFCRFSKFLVLSMLETLNRFFPAWAAATKESHAAHTAIGLALQAGCCTRAAKLTATDSRARAHRPPC